MGFVNFMIALFGCQAITLRVSLLAVILIGSIRSAYSQDSTRNVVTDTLEVVSISQYSKLDLRSSGAYIRKFDYSPSLSASSGISIFNALRGRVPGLTVPSYFGVANSSGVRTGPFPFVNDALLVIDGVPFNNFIGQYANLNAFDYSSIAAFSNTSALNFLGGSNSGAFVLTSKSGEGVEGPLFEFNAYATYGWDELNNPQTNQTYKAGEWYMSNAIAYSQDFGKIDTRVSYTAQKKFYESIAEPLIHYLKVNTGFVASPRLDLRLIVDGRFSKYDDTLRPIGSRPATMDESRAETFLNANLMAKYKLSTAFTVTSQLGTSSYYSNLTQTGQTFGGTEKVTNTYNQANLVLNGSKDLSKKVNVAGFAGFQLFDQTFEQANSAYGPYRINNNSKDNDRYPYFMGQGSFSIDRRFYASASYRDGTHVNSTNSSYSATANAYSLSSSLIFTDWIGKSFLSFGKVRVSKGSHTVVLHGSYPPPDPRYIGILGRAYPYEVTNFETGLDLGFLKSRLNVTLNYYQNQESFSTRGWETDIRFKAVKKTNLDFDSGVVLSNSISQFGNAPESNPYLRLGFLNQVKLKSIQVSMLIESVTNYTGFASNTGFVNTSFTMLRDISIGITLPDSFLGFGTRSARIAVVVRNIAKLGGTGMNVDNASGLSIFQKSASVNLNVTF